MRNQLSTFFAAFLKYELLIKLRAMNQSQNAAMNKARFSDGKTTFRCAACDF